MGESLSELRQAMGAYVSSFDAALVSPEHLGQVVADAGAIEKMAATVSTLAAARMAGGSGFAAKKALSAQRAAEALAKASGTSLSGARRSVEAGQAMADSPEVEKAAKAGELSRDQAALVAGAAQANPAATGRLLETARNGSLVELAAEATKARAAVEDQQKRRERVQAARSLRHWTDEGGTWHLHGQGLPEQGAKIMAAIDQLADLAFDQARQEGRTESSAAYAFDGLVALAGGGQVRSPGYEVMVRVDFGTLVRGYVMDGETCEVAGFGPLSPQAVADIISTEDPFLKTIVTKGKDVVGVAHLGRVPNAYQRSALDWLYPTCAAEGCAVRAQFLQTDHRADWARTHYTVFDLLDRLCARHHRQKTTEGWALVNGKGKRAFVAPGDPRHPGPCPAPAYPTAPPPNSAATGTAPPPGSGGGAALPSAATNAAPDSSATTTPPPGRPAGARPPGHPPGPALF